MKIFITYNENDLKPLVVIDKKLIHQDFFNAVLNSSMAFYCFQQDEARCLKSFPFKNITVLSKDDLLNSLWDFDFILEEAHTDVHHHKLNVFLGA